MKGPYQAVKVSDHAYWVGAIDWGLRDFHGYSTNSGTTYNAYLILADKVTLVDTVKPAFKDEMLSRIASVVDPRDVDYVISNHSEMDHSGCLPQVIEALQPEKVFASTMGVRALTDHFHLDHEIVAVKDMESLSLGNLDLTFVETRMLHWPDSMFTYLAQDGVLFSNDAFGMHLASSGRFDDEVPGWKYEAAKYYANILMPYSPLVAKLLTRVASLKLSPRIIAPDHGPIWRSNPEAILSLYAKWANRKPGNKAIVTYDTMWQSTASMARAIADGVARSGAVAKLMPIGPSHRSDIVTELLDAGAFVVGSPTLNNNMLPTVADVLTYAKGLKPTGLVGAAFGSYGWSGESVAQVSEVLAGMKVELVGESVRVRYVPDADALAQCSALGTAVAERIRELRP